MNGCMFQYTSMRTPLRPKQAILRGSSHQPHMAQYVSISNYTSVKMVGQHLFLNIIHNNFTTRTKRKVWCDWGPEDQQQWSLWSREQCNLRVACDKSIF